MGKGRYLGTARQQLTDGDKEYIKRLQAGERKAPAFRASYPDHPAVIKWHNSEPGSPDRQRASELVIAAAKNKIQAKYFNRALTTYQDKMEEFSELSVETAKELVQHARSEKVRADLAIEGMRHKVGAPTVKQLIKEESTVVLTFDAPPENREIIEGETV